MDIKDHLRWKPVVRRIPETKEEFDAAVAELKRRKLIPATEQQIRVDPRLVDDIRDLLAVHGAGSLGRQMKVHAKRGVAMNWAKAIFGTIIIILILLMALLQ